MSERSLERAESNWPLLHIAVAIIATFSSVTVLLWLLVIGLVALVLVTGGAMAVMNDGRRSTSGSGHGRPIGDVRYEFAYPQISDMRVCALIGRMTIRLRS